MNILKWKRETIVLENMKMNIGATNSDVTNTTLTSNLRTQKEFFPQLDFK